MKKITLFLSLFIWPLLALLFLFAGLQPAAAAPTATVTVCSSGCDYATIQAAVNGVANGSTISLTDPLYTTGNDIQISNKTVTITGQSQVNTTVQVATTPSGGNSPVFDISSGNVTLQDMTIRHGDGAGITVSQGQHFFRNLTITDQVYGHGIKADGATILIENVTIKNLTRGTGIRTSSIPGTEVITISNSTIWNNDAQNSLGGGLYTNGTDVVISATTIYSNQVAYGAGLYNRNATVDIYNSTISGNNATTNGGGIYAWMGGAPTSVFIENSTIVSNSAPNGAGIYLENGPASITLYNSIVANNSGGTDCYNNGGTLTVNSFNLDSDGSCASATTGDPQLGPLQDNGGATPTHQPAPGSPVIDGGENSVCRPIDQRGEARADYTCDIGAVEMQLSDSDTISKSVSSGNSYTFGPTLAHLDVVDDGGCLTGMGIQRVNSDHPQAALSSNPNLQTGVYWGLTPVGCNSGFTVTVSLPTPNFAPDVDDKLCRYDSVGGVWDCGPAVDHTIAANPMQDGLTLNGLTRQNVHQFSQWAAGNQVGPTAVSLQGVMVTHSGPSAWLIFLAGLLLLSSAAVWRQKSRGVA